LWYVGRIMRKNTHKNTPKERPSIILIMKANEMHYSSNLFDKVLYMFRTCPLSITSSTRTLYTRNRYLSYACLVIYINSTNIPPRGGLVVKALHYKPTGRGFDSR
jgi:hypothetical protein